MIIKMSNVNIIDIIGHKTNNITKKFLLKY